MSHALDGDLTIHVRSMLTDLGHPELAPRLRLLTSSYPDPLVCTVLPPLGDGLLRVGVDPTKPAAMTHLRAMFVEHGPTLPAMAA